MLTFDDLLHMKCLDYLNLDLEQKTTDEDAAIVLGYAQSLWLPAYSGLDVMVEKNDDGEYYLVVDTSSMLYSDTVARFPANNNLVMIDLQEWNDVRDLFTEDEWNNIDDLDNLRCEDADSEIAETIKEKQKMAVIAMAIRDYVSDYAETHY